MKNTECRGHTGACRLIGVANARNSSSLISVMSANQTRELCTVEFALREVECPRLCQPAVGLSSFSCLVNRMPTNSFSEARQQLFSDKRPRGQASATPVPFPPQAMSSAGRREHYPLYSLCGVATMESQLIGSPKEAHGRAQTSLRASRR